MKRLVLGAIVVAGCVEPDVPDRPTYRRDIKPILDANCVRCHGEPRIGGSPSNLRLDVWFDPDDGVDGVGAAAYDIFDEVTTGRMPPTYALEAWQIETITRWCDASDCVPAE
jgi:hypothetical protein